MNQSPLFHLHHIYFGYEPTTPLLAHLNFTLKPNERVGLVGANGSGKSTLLQLLVGLHKPQAGTLEAFGKVRVTESDFWEVRCQAGLVFQDPDDQLFCPTVAEDVAFGPLNIGYSPAETTRIVHDTLDALGLTALAERVTYHLSGGEKRLVALATVLAMRPRVLLLDEPTNALDTANRQRLLHLLEGLPHAMVIASHDAEVIQRLTTRCVRLESGRLVEEAASP